MEYTQNYNLKKPGQEDFYNVKDFNDNADIINQALKAHDDALATKETLAGAQAKVDAHAALTTAHSATSAATANRIMMRDANGRAKVAAPSASDDIARKAEVDAVQSNLDSHKAENATLSALGHVKHGIINVTLDTTWSGTSAPFSKTVTVSGILATDTPIIDIVMSGTYSTDEARIEAWGYIYRAVTANGSITFYATEKPTVSLPIQIKVVR